MATTQEVVTILRVDTGEAVKNVGDLKANVKAYKEQLDGLEIGSQEYQDTLSALKVNQNALRDAMYATSASMDDLTKSAQGAGETYNALVHRMASMKEELRNIDVSTKSGKERFAQLSSEINKVNDKLKGMDAAQGNFQRNVGNYEGALNKFAGSLKSMGVNADAMINPLKNVTGGLKALSATPAVAIIGLIASLLTKVIGALKSSEENTNAMTQALSVFAGVGDIAKNVLQTLGAALAKVAEVVANLAYKLFPALREAADKRNEVTKQEIELAKMQRKVNEDNAAAELEIAKLKAAASDKATYSAKERLDFLQQASDKEEEMMKRNLDVARANLKLQEDAANLAGNSTEENNKLSEAKVAVLKAETEYFKKQKELNAQMSEARKAMTAEIEAETKKQASAYKSVEDAIMADITAIDAELDKEAQNVAKQVNELDKVAQAKRDRQLKDLEESATRSKEYNKVTIDDAEVLAAEERRITAETLQRKLEMLAQFSQDARNTGDTTAYLQYQQQMADTEVEIERNKLAEEQRLRKKDRADAEATQKAKLATLQAAASGTSSILSSIADMYEANGENDEEAQKKAKGLRIASATIDTISGAIGAYMQSVKSMPAPYGAIVGAIQAAVVTATGIANIQKIKNTDISANSTGASSSFTATTAPAVQTTTQEVAVTSNSADAVLNQIANTPQKVYILQSDLEAANKTSKVQVSESTFA